MAQDQLTFAKRETGREGLRMALLSDTVLLAYLALLDFILHMLFAGNYGYFRDELYYMADGQHLAFGYVDQPPMIGWLAALVHLLFGDSLIAIHILPALLGALLVFITGSMVRTLGGGRFAQILAAVGAMIAIVFMAETSLFTYDLPDAVCWALGAYIIMRLLKSQNPRYWLLFGLVAGLGLLTKLTILFFGFALVLGLLLTTNRAYFRTRWPWLGGLVAGLVFLPYIIWNAFHGWATVDFWRHYGGLSGDGPLSFLLNQVLLANLLNVPLVILGLLFYFRAPAGKPYRALGWTYVVLYVLFTILNAKPYFLAPVYPMLLAAGAVRCEQIIRRPWFRGAALVALAVNGIIMAPLAMPILPPATFAQTYSVLTSLGNSGAGQHVGGVFPQYLGDRFGWDELTARVTKVYQQLPADEQKEACIYTANYGEASALTLLGSASHLPPIISGHNNYYLWGPGGCSGKVLITIGVPTTDLQQGWQQVTQVDTTSCTYCVGGEDQLPINIATQPRFSGTLEQVWPRFKTFG